MKKLILGLLMLCSCGSHSTDVQVKSPIIPAPPIPLPVKGNIKNIKKISVNKDQVVFLSSEVNETIINVINKIDEINKSPFSSEIYLLIDSPGGSVLDGAKLLSTIEASRKPVYTVCTGMCASMAAIIHQYGTKRYMVDRSVLMFHDAAGGVRGPNPQMRSRLDFFDRLTLKMDAYIANRSGMNLQDLLQLNHVELWLDAEDATGKKLNDNIVYITIKDNLGTNQPIPSFSSYERDKLLNIINEVN